MAEPKPRLRKAAAAQATPSKALAKPRRVPDEVERVTNDLLLDLSNRDISSARKTILLGGDIVITRRERVENVLRRDLPRYADTNTWLAPLGLFASVVLSLVSADFKKTWGISVDAWRMLFAILAIGSAVLTVRGIWRYARRTTIKQLATAIVEGDPVDEP